MQPETVVKKRTCWHKQTQIFILKGCRCRFFYIGIPKKTFGASLTNYFEIQQLSKKNGSYVMNKLWSHMALPLLPQKMVELKDVKSCLKT